MSGFGFFDSYVLRTPTLPVNFYTQLLDNYSTTALFKTVEKSFVQDAIRLASPELLEEYEKYKSNPVFFDVEKAVNLEFSFLKYIARMCTRATPFGMFAGCTVGKISEKTNIILSDEYTIHTQFDMQFWITTIQKLSQNKHVQNQLLYYPNTSLYAVSFL